MGNEQRGQTTYSGSEFSGHFSEKVETIRGGPTEIRSVRDVCCLVTFIILLLAFIVIGSYMINDQRSNFQNISTINTEASTNIAKFQQVFTTYLGLVIGCFALSIIIAAIYVLLMKRFPKQMVYGIIVLIYVLVIALIIILLTQQLYQSAIVLIIAMALYSLYLYCIWGRIAQGIVLLRVSLAFITEKPGVYGVPVWTAFLSILFTVFWIASVLAFTTSMIVNSNARVDNTKEGVFIAFFIIMNIFMTLIFKYAAIFLVATACANWYYGVSDSYFCVALRRLNVYHIGTLTFAAIIVTIIKIIRSLLNSARNNAARSGSTCLACFLCFLECCIANIQALIEVLNENTMILTAITGEGFIDGAKTAAAIILDNLGIFMVVKVIGTIVSIGGIIFVVGIPTLIGVLVMTYSYSATQQLITYVGISILFLSIVLTFSFVDLIGQALNCVFVFYCLDKKFHQIGVIVPNVPEPIKNLITGDYLNAETNVQMQENINFPGSANQFPIHNPPMNPQWNQQGNPQWNQQGNPQNLYPQQNPYQ